MQRPNEGPFYLDVVRKSLREVCDVLSDSRAVARIQQIQQNENFSEPSVPDSQNKKWIAHPVNETVQAEERTVNKFRTNQLFIHIYVAHQLQEALAAALPVRPAPPRRGSVEEKEALFQESESLARLLLPSPLHASGLTRPPDGALLQYLTSKDHLLSRLRFTWVRCYPLTRQSMLLSSAHPCIADQGDSFQSPSRIVSKPKSILSEPPNA